MTKLRWCAGVAASIALAARIASAQDPPPPMLPGDAPAAPPPVSPPPAPDAPPPLVAPLPAPSPSAPPPPATFAPPPSAADAPAPEPATPEPPAPRERRPGAGKRSIKGYVFPTPALIDSAFVTTHVGVGAELGHYWAYGQDPQFSMGNSLSTSGTDIPYDLSAGYTTEYLSLGIAPWERVGFTFDASYTSYVSSDIDGAAFNGSQYAWDIRPGVRFRLLHAPSTGTQIGLHVYGDFNSASQVNPQAALLSIANQITNVCLASASSNGGISQPCTLTNIPATTYTNTVASGGATFSLAQVINSTFALQAALGAEVGYGWINSYGSQINSTPVAFHLGAAPSINLGPAIPITIMAEYLFTVFYVPTQGIAPSSTATEMTPDAGTVTTLQHQLVGGVYYTGRTDLVVGALFTATFASSEATSTSTDDTGMSTSIPQPQPPTRALGGQVTARYFF